MMRGVRWTLVASATFLGATDCSLVLNLDTEQCGSTSDCVAKGPAFRDMVCVHGSCERPVASEASTNTTDGGAVIDEGKAYDGDASTEADRPSDSGGVTHSEQDAGHASSGADAESDSLQPSSTSNPDASLSGDAAYLEAGLDGGVPSVDSGSAAGCVSNAQCVADNLGEPYACMTKGSPCLPLKTTECPLVFGDDFQDENAVYVGAFLNVPAAAPLSQMSTLNVQLAMNEFNGSVGGLPGGPLGKLRPLVTVVCRNDPTLVEAGARHLVDELKVPAVIANLPSGDLKSFFVNRALPASVFVMNPGFADNTLTSLASAGLLWHVIGDIRDVAPAYSPLLARVERFLNGSVDGGSAASLLRVATLVTHRYAEESIADTILPLLQYNGKSAFDNGSDYLTMSVPSLADNPTADYSAINAALLAFQPDVVLAITREEFVYKILPAVEAGWQAAAGSRRRPFYIVPTALSGNLDLLNYVSLNSDGVNAENKRQRFAGVAPASAENLTLYNQFLIRFRTAYPHFQNPAGFENFYDAVYLLVNAMFAAGSPPVLTGTDVARGMQKVVVGGTIIDVGPTRIADGFAALAIGGNIRINGAMGLADFDPGNGARHGNASVYCYNRTGNSVSILYDVLRYASAEATLRGTFPCINGF